MEKITTFAAMKKSFITIALTALSLLTLTNCGRGNGQGDKSAIDVSAKLAGDQMIYGLACDGCSDSVIVFLPNEGGDPVTYHIVQAMRNKKVFGKPEIGDWVGLLLNPKDSTEALLVVDLDQLKGTWTYQVMPTLKESATKTERQINAELTDSMRELLFVPREYGFTLKRHRQATSVGRVMRTNSLADESLVEYPPVPNYTSWATWNGKLILTRDTVDKDRKPLPQSLIQRDTADFLLMHDDTLALRMGGQIIGFHRQESALTANKKANEAVQKQAAKDSIR